MKILYKGKIKKKKDNWYWRCPKCHTIGYHEDDDHYTGFCTSGYNFFSCPICEEEIRSNRYFNRFIAWLLYKIKYNKKENNG